ncbi:MAG: RagB/SusD family nutrient uptake outer membrane protein [Cyclobacteriaceae bacterium]
MKNLKYILAASAWLVFSSCSEDVLDTEAKDAFAEDFVYSSANNLETLVVTSYNSTEGWAQNRFDWWGRRFNIENASFESKFNFNNLNLFSLRGTGLAAGNGGGARWNRKWDNYFHYVRGINEFMDRVDNSEAMANEPDAVNILKAEMRFLRANLYFKLINLFGGVPIMESALGLDAESFNLPRNSYKECVDFIVGELDAAAAVLPETRPGSEFGRATSLAALAVKSRLLVYAASAQHDPANTVDVPRGTLYDYDVATKWQDASNAAKAIIDLVGGRDLIATPDAAAYQALFLSPNEDILFARPYGSEFYEFGTDVNSLWDKTQSPPGYDGWGLSSPTHNFALQFNMADGTGTSEVGTSYDPVNPNDNREMRYYADLLFNGAEFRGREVQYWLAHDHATNENAVNGLESPKTIVGNALHSSKTGYNIRKFQDESIETSGISAGRPRILYRLAEIYLNYAEAQYHLGNEAEARTYLNKVSSRALQPEITDSGIDLYEAIKRERRVELCFEMHNFFDERRWMEKDHLGFDIQGLLWEKDAVGNINHTGVYTVVNRPFYVKHYYLPIPNSEIEKAPAVEQNTGY